MASLEASFPALFLMLKKKREQLPSKERVDSILSGMLICVGIKHSIPHLQIKCKNLHLFYYHLESINIITQFAAHRKDD